MKRFISVLLTVATLISLCIITHMPTTAAVISAEGRLPFADVMGGVWYEKAVVFCYVNGVVKGVSQTEFRPAEELTRASFALMLAKTVEADTDGYSNAAFFDTPAGKWHSKAIAWAVHQGYMAGTGEGYFSPDAPLTREQLAGVFMRYMDKAGLAFEEEDSVLNTYTDRGEISSWAKAGMVYAVSAGLIKGTSAITLSPKMNVSRAQAAQVFMTFIREHHRADCKHQYMPATCIESKTCELCGLKEGLPMGHTCTILNCVTADKCTVCGTVVSADPSLHKYTDATCDRAATCTVCTAVKGIPLGHNIISADCSYPSRCTRCGITAGAPLGHSYTTATCIRPATCTRCGATKGTVTSHSYMFNGVQLVCSICGKAGKGALSGKKICIDPGHGNYTKNKQEPIGPGSSETKNAYATGTSGSYQTEAEFNLAMAYLLKPMLESHGAIVYMTRTDANSITNIERAVYANNLGCDMVVRIHADGVSSTSANGISMLVPGRNQFVTNNDLLNRSRICGDIVLQSVISRTGAKNRGVIERTDLTGFNWSTVPSILIECGFMSNPAEDRKLADPAYRTLIAEGITEGLIRYFSTIS